MALRVITYTFFIVTGFLCGCNEPEIARKTIAETSPVVSRCTPEEIKTIQDFDSGKRSDWENFPNGLGFYVE